MLPSYSNPTTTVTLPSKFSPNAGKKVKIQPFVMKQQKALILAEKSDDINDIIDAIVDIIKSQSNINPDTLNFAELQWLFLEIRKISVGSKLPVTLTCEKCGEEIASELDLNDFKYVEKEQELKLMIDSENGIMLKIPTVGDVNKSTGIQSIIDFVFDANEIYKFEDYSQEDVDNYLDNLPIKTVKEIEEFYENLPKFVLDKTWKCISCGHENKIHIEGIGAFFG